MKAVYVEEVEKILKYFVCGFKKDEDECEEYHFEGIKTIAEKAFYAPWNVKRVFFDETLATIKKEAFKDCGELEVFCCGSEGDYNLLKGIEPNELLVSVKDTELQDSEKGESLGTDSEAQPSDSEQNQEIREKSETEFSVQTSAFVNCEDLHTVIFPKCDKLKIEKKAFAGCSSLRTVVADVKDIDFTENPFEGCPRELVFVCSKDSAVERFARENGYRSVYVH